MRGKLLIYLSAFAAVILVAIWLLNIVFLDDIYGVIKKSQVTGAAELICEALEEGAGEEAVYSIADEKNVCVSVYKIRNGVGKAFATAHVNSFCRIHKGAADTVISDIYEKAEDGQFYEVIPSEEEELPDSALCAAVTDGEDCRFLTVISTEIEPVGATLTTLRYLFVWITVFVVAVSVVMAYIISKSITRPVIEMNETAKKLAVGNYDVNFCGDGFLETAELAGTLNYAASELGRMDAMQKELIANISHDLRTPLTTIMGFTEIMRDIPGENTPENMQVVIDETRRLSDLVSDMLDVSRLTAGTRKPQLECFSLSKVISETLERYNTLREREGYKFIFTAEEDAVVNADKTLILQVVYNLINNAVNYCGEDKTVEVDLSVNEKVARVSVTDRGEGIAPEKLPLIWDRYYKAGGYHKRAVLGTGLGLSIVKNALILHGADFGVYSTVGSGSTFWFELPTA